MIKDFNLTVEINDLGKLKLSKITTERTGGQNRVNFELTIRKDAKLRLYFFKNATWNGILCVEVERIKLFGMQPILAVDGKESTWYCCLYVKVSRDILVATEPEKLLHEIAKKLHKMLLAVEDVEMAQKEQEMRRIWLEKKYGGGSTQLQATSYR